MADREERRKLSKRSRSSSSDDEGRKSRSSSKSSSRNKKSKKPLKKSRSRSRSTSSSSSPQHEHKSRRRRRNRSSSLSRSRSGERKSTGKKKVKKSVKRKKSRSSSRSSSRSKSSASRSNSHSSSSSSSDSEYERKKAKKSKHKTTKKKKKSKKTKKKEKKKTHAVNQNNYGKYGILSEADQFSKQPEFYCWLQEVRMINPEVVPRLEIKRMFETFMEDYNTATFPHKKYYNLEQWELKHASKRRLKQLKKAQKNPISFANDESNHTMKFKGKEKRYGLSKEKIIEMKRAIKERTEQEYKKNVGFEHSARK